MYGIQGWGTYVPYRRLDRSQIASVTGTHGGSGTRAVAGYDEDTGEPLVHSRLEDAASGGCIGNRPANSISASITYERG